MNFWQRIANQTGLSRVDAKKAGYCLMYGGRPAKLSQTQIDTIVRNFKDHAGQ